MTSPSTPRSDGAEILRAVTLLLPPTGITEIRALDATLRGKNRSGTVSGYFDSPAAVVEALGSLGTAKGIYIIPNVVDPALHSRAFNRLRLVEKSDALTTDSNILRRRWLLIDCDAVRPAGIGSTDAEHAAALDLARRVREYLEGMGFPPPVLADSGNGAHLLYRIDLPADDGGLVHRCLAAIAAQLSSDTVKIDTTVHNPSRIWKLYGTPACKGDSTPERPHRLARILEVPDELTVAPESLLRELGGSPSVAAVRIATEPAKVNGVVRHGKWDLAGWIGQYLPDARGPKPWQGGGQMWSLPACPFNPDHVGGSAFIGTLSDGKITAGCHHQSCQHWDWHTLRAKFESAHSPPSPPSSGHSDPSGGSVSPSSNDWPDPQVLPSGLPPVMPFDLAMLPAALRGIVADIAERIQCPIDFVAVTAVVALGGVAGRAIGIRPKKHDDWLVVPNLWGGVIGRPGVMKTPAIQEPMRPLKQLEVQAKQDFDRQQKDRDAAELVAKAKQRDTDAEIKEALKEGRERAMEVAAEAISDDPEEPVRTRYLVNDSTVEKLGEILNQNPRGIMVFRDELVGFLKALDKDGQECARAFYLEAWNGTNRFTFDRIGRGTVDIESACVSIIGGIQPGPLRQYLRDAAKGGFGDDGLVQRFQLMVWPDVSPTWKNVDRAPDRLARERAWKVFEGLARIDPILVEADPDPFDTTGIPFLRFDDEAQVFFDEWRAGLERLVRSGDLHPALESHLAKFRSLIPSLALLFHLADGKKGPVDAEALRTAIRWDEYLRSHARRIYSVAIDADVAAARTIAKKILEGELSDGFALRDIYRNGWSGLTSAEESKDGVELLVDLDWLAERRVATPGRTKITYSINSRVPGSRAAKTLLSPQNGTDKGDRSYPTPPSVSSGGSDSEDSQKSEPPGDTWEVS